MKMKLAIVFALFACHGYAAGECKVLFPQNSTYLAIMERMGTIADKAPSRIEFCGDYGFYWKTYWDTIRRRNSTRS